MSEKLRIWLPIDSAPEGECVETRKGGLWFFPDMSMYVYYTPMHWRRP